MNANLRRLGRAIRENLGTLLAVTSIAFTLVYVRYTDHLFCQVITGVTSTPAQRPADPQATPAQEKQFELYQKFVRLGEGLGC